MLTHVDLIRRVPLFSKLTPDQATSLAGAVVKRQYKRGEKIVEQGKHSDSLFIILAGRARVVVKNNHDREVILATLHSGDCVGEMSVVDGEPHSATVEAEVTTDLLLLSGSDFRRCLTDNAAIAVSLLTGLVQRLRHADRKIESLALVGVCGRVANALLDGGELLDNRVRHIKTKISRQDLAKTIGASREMVSRVMKDFEEHGFIETLEDGSVLVKERRKLPR